MGSDRSMVWRLKRPRCEGHRVWAESQGKLNRNAISASAAGDKTSTRLCIWTEESWCAMGAAVQVVHLHYTTWFTHPCRSIIHLCDWNDCGFFCLFVFLWNEHVAWMELGWNSKLGKAYKCSHPVAAVFYSRQLVDSWDVSMTTVYVTSDSTLWMYA